jgi:uncharacterized protein YdhG (YjbR/CyaY superfamily)
MPHWDENDIIYPRSNDGSMGVRQKNVDEYIRLAPRAARTKLAQLRKIIRSAAPKAVERISYGMPYYGHKGRLAYFQLAKTHIGLYIPPPVIAQHKDQLKAYGTSTATVRFPLDEKLPIALIRRLIKARIKKNEEGTGK